MDKANGIVCENQLHLYATENKEIKWHFWEYLIFPHKRELIHPLINHKGSCI